MGTGRLKTLAFLSKAVGKIRPAARCQNPTLDHRPGISGVAEEEKKSYEEKLLHLLVCNCGCKL